MPANRIPKRNSTMIVIPIVAPRSLWPIREYPAPGTSHEQSATRGGAEKGADEFDIEGDTLACGDVRARDATLGAIDPRLAPQIDAGAIVDLQAGRRRRAHPVEISESPQV